MSITIIIYYYYYDTFLADRRAV